MSQSIKMSDRAYEAIKGIAEKTRRSLIDTLDIIVEAYENKKGKK